MKPTSGDIFFIPTSAGDFILGQVIALEKRGMLCISCGLFDQRVSESIDGRQLSLDETKCFSTLLVTPPSFKGDRWPVVQNQKLVIPKKYFPYEKELSKGGIGSKMYDPGIVENFVAAFYGLKPWDMYFKPDYFDDLLIFPNKKPAKLIYKNDQ